MRLGLHYWNYSTPSDPAEIAGTLAETARVADQAGFSVLTVMDHYFQMDQPGMCSPDEPMLESYTTLGYAAGLTEREITMLKALARGLSNRDISQELWVTEKTVKFHLGNIFLKLAVANRTEAARVVYEQGLGSGAKSAQAPTRKRNAASSLQ